PALTAAAIFITYLVFYLLIIKRCDLISAGCRPLAIKDYLSANEACPSFSDIRIDDEARLWPGRILWAFVMGAGFIANLFAVGVSLRLIWKTRVGDFRGRTRRRARRAASRAVAYTLLIFLLISGFGLFVRPESMASQMYELLACTAAADLPFVNVASVYANFINIGAAACVIIASCALISSPGGRRRQDERELAARMESLRALLYTGTAALVLAVLRVSVQANWALAYLAPEPDKRSAVAAAMARLASAVTSGQSASNTLFLAAVYVPAFLVLRARWRWPTRALRRRSGRSG
ncbi:MAG TPA: hypothetical protein VJ866_24305, partial [Pyrinomonadaceae bacterium]|nr:hypothetical protein [Pyrinomonadaceae bacterium]